MAEYKIWYAGLEFTAVHTEHDTVLMDDMGDHTITVPGHWQEKQMTEIARTWVEAYRVGHQAGQDMVKSRLRTLIGAAADE